MAAASTYLALTISPPLFTQVKAEQSPAPLRGENENSPLVARPRGWRLDGSMPPCHAILRGPSGEPVCAAPWRVSIAHTREIALAVAWNADEGPDLGVDIELASDVTSDLATEIASAEEQAAVADLDFGLAVLFSAKESAIKALRRLPRSGFRGFSSRRLAVDQLMLTAASPGGPETRTYLKFG